MHPPISNLQIIVEKSSLSTLLSSMGISSGSRKNSSSHECIREVEERIATKELDPIAPNDRFQQVLNAILVAQIQDIEELRRKQQKELEAVKMD